MLASLFGESFSGDPEQKIDDAQHDRSNKRGQEAIDREAGHDSGRQLQHQRIDHEPEQADRDNGDWKRDDFQEKAKRGVDEADNDRCEQRGAEPVNQETRNEPGHQKQRQRTEQPIEQQFHHGSPS